MTHPNAILALQRKSSIFALLQNCVGHIISPFYLMEILKTVLSVSTNKPAGILHGITLILQIGVGVPDI